MILLGDFYEVDDWIGGGCCWMGGRRRWGGWGRTVWAHGCEEMMSPMPPPNQI